MLREKNHNVVALVEARQGQSVEYIALTNWAEVIDLIATGLVDLGVLVRRIKLAPQILVSILGRVGHISLAKCSPRQDGTLATRPLANNEVWVAHVVVTPALIESVEHRCRVKVASSPLQQ